MKFIAVTNPEETILKDRFRPDLIYNNYKEMILKNFSDKDKQQIFNNLTDKDLK